MGTTSGKTIIISGGNVTANGSDGGVGIGGGADDNGDAVLGGAISLSWTDKENDSITASSYGGTVTFEKDFFIDGGSAVLTADTISSANGMKIAPLPSIPLPPSITYRYLSGRRYQTVTTSEYIEVTQSIGTTWTAGTYAMLSNVTLSDRITIEGTVNLILVDGFTIDARNGFYVPVGSKLNIHAGTMVTAELASLMDDTDGIAGTGTLNAGVGSTLISGNPTPGIGGGGEVTIDGGIVNAQGLNNGAGIGGGGSVTINGGTVTATGGTGNDGYEGGAGIGNNGNNGGEDAEKTAVNITGGTVTANGTDGGAGIGGGDGGNGGDVTISGDADVTANGGTLEDDEEDIGGAGIGGGSAVPVYDGDEITGYEKGDGGNVNILNAKVAAKGGNGADDIGKGSNAADAGVLKVNNRTLLGATWPPAYTITAKDTTTEADKKYKYGEEVTVNVIVSGNPYEGGEFVLTYDAALLEFESEVAAPVEAESASEADKPKNARIGGSGLSSGTVWV